tara:strand:- start:547 stop:678 length:132 start_codon:yes stop_codon:yes gene_type:complete
VAYGENSINFAIQTVNLTKYYGKQLEIQNLNLKVEKYDRRDLT